jgi:tetratricopeptide (TPR) repeat protein
MGKKQSWRRKHLYFFIAFIIITQTLVIGCTHLYEKSMPETDFRKANYFMEQGDYVLSILKYEQILASYPLAGDRSLFEMGIIYASPGNQQKDYQKSLECFHRLIKNYPESTYRQKSDVMISLINEVTSSDRKMISQQKQIEKLEQQVEEFEKKIEQLKEADMNLKKKMEQLKEVDMNLKKRIEQMKEVDINIKQKKKPLP